MMHITFPALVLPFFNNTKKCNLWPTLWSTVPAPPELHCYIVQVMSLYGDVPQSYLLIIGMNIFLVDHWMIKEKGSQRLGLISVIFCLQNWITVPLWAAEQAKGRVNRWRKLRLSGARLDGTENMISSACSAGTWLHVPALIQQWPLKPFSSPPPPLNSCNIQRLQMGEH